VLRHRKVQKLEIIYQGLYVYGWTGWEVEVVRTSQALTCISSAHCPETDFSFILVQVVVTDPASTSSWCLSFPFMAVVAQTPEIIWPEEQR
jgi:hypothetical protein